MTLTDKLRNDIHTSVPRFVFNPHDKGGATSVTQHTIVTRVKMTQHAIQVLI